MFIRGLNLEDHYNVWKERYTNTRTAELPATYDDIIEDIHTFGISSVPNQKGSSKDGNIQAYAADLVEKVSRKMGKMNRTQTHLSPKKNAGIAVL